MFTYHGPKGYIGFNPQVSPENFKAPFTVAYGWETYTQDRQKDRQRHMLTLKHGSLRLQRISLFKSDDHAVKEVTAIVGKQKIPVTFSQQQREVTVDLGTLTKLLVNQTLFITIR